MTQKNPILIAGCARTAIASFGGALKNTPPCDTASLVIKHAIERSHIKPDDVDHVVLGNVIHTEPRDMYISRVAAIEAGIPVKTPAFTVNRLCGSGLQAIVSATQLLQLGDANIAVAGGAESMSRSGYLLPNARWGQKMGNTQAIDMMTMALHDPFDNGHMGVTAENIASQQNISRERQDEFAVESHKRAAHARNEGYFEEQIVPVMVKHKRQEIEFKTDEHIREGTTIEDMQSLKPVFKKDGSVTPGNASGLNDGAGALVLMTQDTATQKGVTPMARLVSYGFAGVDPSIMGMGPVGAVQQALSRAQLKLDDLDVIESNEAFAAQACAVSDVLGFDPDKVNPNGGAIALGHPIGASGAIIAIKLVYELKRIKGRYGLATMCIGGGQGIAIIIEAM